MGGIKTKSTKLREGPLEKLWGEWGIIDLQEFFFVIIFLV